MGLHGDAAGIEGLPLQLLIVAIVMGITVPVVYAGLDAYDHGQVARRVEGEVLRLAHAAQQYAVAGGGAETLELDFRGGSFTSVLYVWIGDRPGGAFPNVRRYRLEGGARREDPRPRSGDVRNPLGGPRRFRRRERGLSDRLDLDEGRDEPRGSPPPRRLRLLLPRAAEPGPERRAPVHRGSGGRVLRRGGPESGGER